MRAKAKLFSAGPWSGMRDSVDVTAASPKKARLIQNAYPTDSAAGGGIVGRPGFLRYGSGTSLGSVGQCIQEWDVYAGVAQSVKLAVYSGQLWQLTASTTTLLVSTATLTAASITFSGTTRVSSVILGCAGTVKVIFSDGVNVPWAYGPTVRLTDCPVLYGPPTLYYAKMFGIKNANRTTFVWSEENDATIGYEAGGYNNAWDFTQASGEPLTALLGTNEGLYVFRESSITLVTGSVDSDFATSGTRSGISETLGTLSPWSVMYANRTVYFLNQHGRPCMIRAGGAAEEIWHDFAETIKLVNKTYHASALTVDYSALSLIMFGLVETGQTSPSMWLVYDISSGSPVAVAVWRGYNFSAAKLVKADNIPHLVHLHPTDGQMYRHALPGSDNYGDPAWRDNGEAITHIVRSGPMAADLSGEKLFDRVDWALGSEGSTQTNSLDYITPRGTSTAQALAATTAAHQSAGINAHGRWIEARITHSTPEILNALQTEAAVGLVTESGVELAINIASAGEQFKVLEVMVRGIATTDAQTNP